MSHSDLLFQRGVKTAAIPVDAFLMANEVILALSNDQMYSLAKDTAVHDEKRVDCDQLAGVIARLFTESSVTISDLKKEKRLQENFKQARSGRISAKDHAAKVQIPQEIKMSHYHHRRHRQHH